MDLTLKTIIEFRDEMREFRAWRFEGRGRAMRHPLSYRQSASSAAQAPPITAVMDLAAASRNDNR
jgi:hypothetical protein